MSVSSSSIMSDTPTSFTGSWVDLSGDVLSSGTVSPIALGSESHYMRMLREAQGETSNRTSCRTSCRVSPYMSHNSPKSPPNSPNNEKEDDYREKDWSGVYINTISEGDSVAISDFIWDWSSRPNITPPKQWKFKSNHKSYNTVFKATKRGNKFMYTVVITNIVSLIIGVGIGVWFFRNTSQPEQVLVQVN